ncbi:hypothetical protein BRADI_3g28308v3 [Brachypodium distachyon]|uniref:Endonuclease/exonuclease/phosphatase domain-containing protein n=1 Tax=Brachypodium distachyon TaxID=15368 RepID=A0A2K2CZQ2_BRADI|nr:hypothetical protein BRADI_3g28308v3 [Brachypodium distachyon]
MADTNVNILVWNVRGLNSRAKHIDVRQVVASSGACIIGLQETKLSVVSQYLLDEFLGPEFDSFFYLPATGTRGGIILAWKGAAVRLANPHVSSGAVTASVLAGSGGPWWITIVYGP